MGRQTWIPRVPGFTEGRTPGDRRSALRALLASGETVVVPGVTDAMGARLVEQSGLPVAYLTGAGLANAQYGLPDVGLVTQTEMVQHVERISSAVDLPLIVDADTGYGNPVAAMRTVHLLHRAGAAAVQIEDQQMPKRCGHFDRHELIATEHMQAKIAAAKQVAGPTGPLLIARTDARSAFGSIDEAIRRGRAYVEAGADAVFVEAPRTVEELQRVGRELAGTPLIVNVVEGGRTPQLSSDEYAQLGFTVQIFANFLMRSMWKTGQEALKHLAENRETASRQSLMATWKERQDFFHLPEFQAAEAILDAGYPIEGKP